MTADTAQWVILNIEPLGISVVGGLISIAVVALIVRARHRAKHLIDASRTQREMGVRAVTADMFQYFEARTKEIFDSVNAKTYVYMDEIDDKTVRMRAVVHLSMWRRALSFRFPETYTLWGEDVLDDLKLHRPDFINGTVRNTGWHIVIRVTFRRPPPNDLMWPQEPKDPYY